MKEDYYDGVLNIRTSEVQKGFSSFLHYHRYEPTPYHALTCLFDQYELTECDRVVDFGCGKGRLNFYIHHHFRSKVVGVEMNETFYREAKENLARYKRKHKAAEEEIKFAWCTAENYSIDIQDNTFYFFNPFSIQIFMQVINQILMSVEVSNRSIDVILYYPSGDYIFFLENQTAFELVKEVRLPTLYENNSNEKFLIYRLSL